MVTAQEVHAGQAIYGRFTLRLYDFVVLKISNHLLWRCPTRKIEELFQKNVGCDHLDVGVGSGYFLDRFAVSTDQEHQFTLMDLNQTALSYASHRIRRMEPRTICANVLEPIANAAGPFDSISMNYLLHCLPGTMPEKSIVFDNLCALLAGSGVVFGSTLLGQGCTPNWAARQLMEGYNKRGVFCNREDSMQALSQQLSSRFGRVKLQQVGCAAIFECREPKAA